MQACEILRLHNGTFQPVARLDENGRRHGDARVFAIHLRDPKTGESPDQTDFASMTRALQRSYGHGTFTTIRMIGQPPEPVAPPEPPTTPAPPRVRPTPAQSAASRVRSSLQRADIDQQHTERECEIKVGVDQTRFASQDLPPAWCIVQGYQPTQTADLSLRIIPALEQADFRHETFPEHGCRLSQFQRVDYAEALHELVTMPTVALKQRYLVRDPATGRAWLVDHFLTDDSWIAESAVLPDQPDPELPAWATQVLTDQPTAYTKQHAIAATLQQRKNWLAFAARHGSDASYTPAEQAEDGQPFAWVQPPELAADDARLANSDPAIPVGAPVHIPDPDTALEADRMPRDPATVEAYEHDFITEPTPAQTLESKPSISKAEPAPRVPVKTIVKKTLQRDRHHQITGVIEEHIPIYKDQDGDDESDPPADT